VYVFSFEVIIKNIVNSNKPDYYIINGKAKIPILNVSEAKTNNQ
jgi:hypothetical protein